MPIPQKARLANLQCNYEQPRGALPCGMQVLEREALGLFMNDTLVCVRTGYQRPCLRGPPDSGALSHSNTTIMIVSHITKPSPSCTCLDALQHSR